MKTFKTFLAEARGIYHPDKRDSFVVGPDDKLYTIKSNGPIVDWETFKQNKKTETFNDKTPKYYAEMEDENGKSIYLCSSAGSGVSIEKFPGWSNVTKSKTKTLKLKPQDFPGILDKWLTIEQLKNNLFSAIDNRKDLEPAVKDYLKTSFLHYSFKGVEITNYDAVKDNRNSIIKDYGEILGAVWELSRNDTTGKIFLPKAGNEPLIDSIIQMNDEKVKISSKGAGKTTNTIKSIDIFKILENFEKSEQRRIKKKFKDELKLLELIKDNSIIIGTIKAFNTSEKRIARLYKSEITKMLSMKFKDMQKIDISLKGKKFLKDIQTLVSYKPRNKKYNNKYSLIFATMSKYIETKSKSMKFAELADKFLNGRVKYIHVKNIDKEGYLTFNTSEKNIPISSGYLRYKDGVTRSSDKLGIQLN